MALSEGTAIDAGQFVDDSGEKVGEFADFGREGFMNVYVNGVLQEGGMYQVTPHAISFAATGQTIAGGTPIVIESVGFAAELVYK